METRHTTEGIDNEILDQARRHAAAHLEEADRLIDQIRQNAQETMRREDDRSATELQVHKDCLSEERTTLLPLECRRLRLKWESARLRDALESWALALSPIQWRVLLEPRLRAVVPIVAGRPVKVQLFAMGPESSSWIREALQIRQDGGFEVVTSEPPSPLLKGVILETLDERLTYRITGSELVEGLLDDHVGELRASLFPEAGPS